MTRRWAGLPVFGAVVLLSLVVLFTPGSDVPSDVPVSDKVVHCGLFAALAVSGRLAGLRAVPLALGLVAYAGITEALQATLPINRHGDVRDAVADTLGVLAGVVLVALLLRKRRVGG